MASVATAEHASNGKFLRKHVILCCLSLDAFPKCTQFVICAAGIMVVFLGYGYTQELMFHIEGFKPHGFYLTFVQFVLYGIFAFVERKMRNESGRTAPLRTHLLLSVLSVGTIGLSNASLGYLNYPTQVLFKCCKLIPVLLGGVLIQGKKYNYLDLLAAVLMSVGLAAFILTDNKLSPTFSLIGVAMILTALLFDAAIGNMQEKAMTAYGTSNSEIMVFSYSIGSVILFFVLATMQDLTPAVKFFARHPVETYGYAAIFSILGYLGIQLVLTLISISGAFVTVVVTTFRKALSIILSFMLFAKPFSFQYVWSGTLVLLGVYIHAYSKKLAKLQLRLPLTHQEKQFS
uniref:Adenosine 3'-phospho 5'-phosphosulfate transporter 2 n=1 Tax=Hyalomma excavatum TaxID=257692 RepID=A0A131XDJ2_9ACAR